MKQKDRISPVERLNHVRAGLQQGKSQRAMAKELGCDEGTIRRDLKKLRLADNHRTLVEQGASAEPFLRTVRGEEALDELWWRVQEEANTGSYSDDVARAGLLYLMKQKDLVRANEVMIMDQVARNLWPLGDVVALPRRNPLKTFARCEVGELPSYMPERIEYYISTLTRALVQIAPEKLIREKAIEKMTKAVEHSDRRR
jgi:transposase-like protein